MIKLNLLITLGSRINSMKRIVILLSFFTAVAFGLQSQPTQAKTKSTYTMYKVTSIKKTAYHNKSNNGAVYSTPHKSKKFNLKSYPHTTWYVTKSALVKHRQGKKNVVARYFYIKNNTGKMSGWVWNQYLKSGAAAFYIRAPHAVAIDAQTGKVLYSKDGNTAVPVASMIKTLTAYMAYDKIAHHKGSWSSKVSVGSGAAKMSRSSDCGGFVMHAGSKYTVKQLMDAALIDSSNAVATRLGVWVSGSNAKHIRAMSNLLSSWGVNAHIVSASGLDNTDLSRFKYQLPGSGYWDQNYISANGMAVIGRNLLNRFPQVTKITSENDMKVCGQTIHNVNTTLPGRKYNVPSLKIDGLKNGYTGRAGYCLMGTGKMDGKHRIITVVVNDENMSTDTTALMQHGYKKM